MRLVTRLTLSMLAVALVTAVIIVTSIQVGFWTIQSPVAARPESEQYVRRMIYSGIVVGVVLAAVVAVVFARFIAKQMAGPIEDVSRASVQLAQGDLSVRVLESTKMRSLEAITLTHNFNKMADALQTYERERRDMIASIAHDLRTPLSAMQIRLELIKELVVPYSEAETDLLLGQTQLLGRLVNDLRTLSLADAGKLSLQLRRFELGSYIESVLRTCAHRTEETGVKLLFQRPEETIWVNADAQRLTQVLSNLLDNALSMTPDGGGICLRLRHENGAAMLSVEDDGPGIPNELLPYLFDRFVQGKDKTGSSGLGLAIVKTLVNLHGGTVSADNRAEGGARFTVTLPDPQPFSIGPSRLTT